MVFSRALVVSEFRPEHSNPGVRLRHAHVRAWLTEQGIDVTEAYLWDTNGAPRLQRGLGARRGAGLLRGVSSTDTAVIVLGLCAPHMLGLASRYARHHAVVFDACDSWIGQVSSRARQFRVGLVAPALVGAVRQPASSRRLAISYISERDRVRDQVLNRGRAAFVIPPAAPRGLAALGPVRFPLERVVMAADLGSFHNKLGFSWFLRSALQLADELPVRFEVYGPVPPREPLPPNMRYFGWVDSIRSIYEGDTGVVVPNLAGSGVPNKLLEAAASGRPAVVHRSWEDCRVPPTLRWSFDDPRSLTDAIRSMVDGSGGSIASANLGRAVGLTLEDVLGKARG